MTLPDVLDPLSLHRALGATRAPEKITQEAFEFNDQHLRRLARLKPGDKAEAGDLQQYTQDLLYIEIQSALLIYLLPFCLAAWRQDLQGGNGFGAFVEYFYKVLADRHVFDRHLNPKQATAVSFYMQQAILEEIDEQRGLFYQGAGTRPYRWIGALTSYGVLRPDLREVWGPWWPVQTRGRAVAAIQYISCLLYPQYENPIFAPWTSDRGGGPPCLWEFAGHLYEHCWQPQNVAFLRQTLNSNGVQKTLSHAVAKLVAEPEHAVARQVEADLPLLAETLEARCLELPQLLEDSKLGKTFEWSK